MRSILQFCAAHGVRRTLEPETVILHEGQSSGRLYILVEGTVEVTRGDTSVAVVNEPGAIFGEMSELLDKPHSATVRTVSAATVYELEDAATALQENAEVAYSVAQLLAKRLYAATTYLVDLKTQFEGRDDHFGLVDAVSESLIHHQDYFTPGSASQPDPPE